MKKQFKKRAKIIYFCLFFILLAVLAPKVKAVWNEPSAVPPNDNLYGVLTIGPEDQARSGALKFGASGTVASGFMLEVASPGAQINDLNINGLLKVDGNTFVVDPSPTSGYVNLGNFGGTNVRLGVNGNISVGASGAEIPGRAIQGISSGDYGVYGIGKGAGNSGVYGENTGSDYGVEGRGLEATGVKGENPSGANGIGVKGESQGIDANDYGIYAENTNPAGKWAGSFEGKIESTDEVVGSKFLPTKLQNSLVPYTSGFKIAEYSGLNATANRAFDGTHLWSVGNGKVSKVRASDGFRIFDKEIGTNPSDVVFDGNYVWVTDRNQGIVRKIDPQTGGPVAGCSNISTGSQPVSAVFDGEYIWVSAYENSQVTRVSTDCSSWTTFSVFETDRPGLGNIIFDGNYVWTTYYDSVSDNDAIIRIDKNGNPVVYLWLYDYPFDISFDGSSYWVTSVDTSGEKNIYYLTKFYFRENACDRSTKKCVNNPSLGCYEGGIYHDDYCPIFEDYQMASGPSFITFDGTYIWLANIGDPNIGDQSLSRILAADPTGEETGEERVDFPLSFEPKGLTFDGTYLWVGNSSGLSKYYSGTGWGHTDLSMTLALQDNNPLISQSGNFNVSGSGDIMGDISVGGDLSVLNNKWGTEIVEDIVPVQNNVATCPEGHFIKNIVADLDGVISEIQCRPL